MFFANKINDIVNKSRQLALEVTNAETYLNTLMMNLDSINGPDTAGFLEAVENLCSRCNDLLKLISTAQEDDKLKKNEKLVRYKCLHFSNVVNLKTKINFIINHYLTLTDDRKSPIALKV